MAGIPGGNRVKLTPLMPRSPDSSRKINDAILASDRLHLHGVWESLIRKTARAAYRLGKPYIIAPHGMLDRGAWVKRPLRKGLPWPLVIRTMLNRASFLHVLNRDEQGLLAPLGLRCPTQVIPNGIFLTEIDQSLHATPATTTAEPFILFLSRLHYKKGLDYLADAFAAVHAAAPQWRLVVAGPDGGEKQPFIDRISQLNLSSRVQVVEPVYGPAKYDLIRQAGCFCLPSRQEGFSVAILEALACRVPVVISEHCHFPEVAETGAGLVVPLSAESIAAALLELVKDPQRRTQMGEAGCKLVEQHFTWQKVAARRHRGVSSESRQSDDSPHADRKSSGDCGDWRSGACPAVFVVLLTIELVARFKYGLCDPALLVADSEMEYLFAPSQHCRQFGNDIIFNRYSMRCADDFPKRKARLMNFGSSSSATVSFMAARKLTRTSLPQAACRMH